MFLDTYVSYPPLTYSWLTFAQVVDSDMQILPRGGVGELVVEGPLVGRGYHGRPDLTKKVFLEWPEKGCWAYKTGDLVRECTCLGKISQAH